MENRQIITALLLALVFILLFAAGWVVYLSSNIRPVTKACTQEAKICPDGSFVGRTGPDCEFAKCPVH